MPGTPRTPSTAGIGSRPCWRHFREVGCRQDALPPPSAVPSATMSTPSPETPSARTTSRSWSWSGGARATPRSPALPSADADLDAPVARLGHLVLGRDQRLSLPAPGGGNAVGGNAAADELIAHTLGPAQGERVIEGDAPDAVGVADYCDLRVRARGELGRELLQHLLGLGGQLVLALDEVQRERHR